MNVQLLAGPVWIEDSNEVCVGSTGNITLQEGVYKSTTISCRLPRKPLFSNFPEKSKFPL
jgi:hypothetical protein